MSNVIGIDIAKNTFDVATPLPNGKYRTRGKIPNNAEGFAQLDQWLKLHAQPDARVVMEATSVYHEALAEHLYHQGYEVIVVNPARVHYFKKSEGINYKTDKVDAKLLAAFAQAKHESPLTPWAPEPVAIRRLRVLLRRLDDLQEMLQMERNRQEVADTVVQESIQSHISHIEKDIVQTRQMIKQHVDDDPDLRGKRDLLLSIDGIGEKTASVILAELGDLKEFRSARAVVSFAGLNPQLAESGKFKDRTLISKAGSGRIRRALYLPSITAMNMSEPLMAMKERLRAKGKAGKQIVCAVMRKMLHIVFGVLKSGHPYDPKLALAR
ncbi:transposase [Pseudomonas sp. MPFS]|uniref:IS110 family transposase n=1 Tax=Pseudomonas sp. MPFS TaxID=2795724 RepID=UPI001F142EB4|nr:transposase [Pseudomonas sp. MPFS]UMZ14755.1 transposase [Pseudomonas sp. MPFS]